MRSIIPTESQLKSKDYRTAKSQSLLNEVNHSNRGLGTVPGWGEYMSQSLLNEVNHSNGVGEGGRRLIEAILSQSLLNEVNHSNFGKFRGEFYENFCVAIPFK